MPAGFRLPEPTFSIVIPTHNYGHMIHTALESVVGQGRDDVEILVIDDASTDNTSDVVSNYAEATVYVRLEKNVGPALAWQYGLEMARGEFVCKLDADDWQLPGFMNAVEAAFRISDNVGMVAGSVLIAKEGEDFVHLKPIAAPTGLIEPAEFRRLLLERFFFHMPAVATRRSAIAEHLPMKAELRMPHDWEFFLRSLRGWSCHVIPPPLAVYRIHRDSLTRTGRRGARLRRDMERLLAATADRDDPAYLLPDERRRFHAAVATTYLRTVGPTIAPLDAMGAMSEVSFALRLAAGGGASGVARVAWHTVRSVATRGARAFLERRRRHGIPLSSALPGGAMWFSPLPRGAE